MGGILRVIGEAQKRKDGIVGLLRLAERAQVYECLEGQ